MILLTLHYIHNMLYNRSIFMSTLYLFQYFYSEDCSDESIKLNYVVLIFTLDTEQFLLTYPCHHTHIHNSYYPSSQTQQILDSKP